MLSFIKEFKSFIKPYRLKLFIAIFSMIFVDLANYVLPELVTYLSDKVYPYINEPGMMRRMIWVCIALIASGIFRGILSYVMIYNYWGVGVAVSRDLRNALYDKIQHLQLAFYDQTRIGDLMSRMTSDLNLVRNFFAFGIEHRLRIILITVTVFILMLILSWQMALIVYGILPVFMVIILHYSKKMREAVDKKQAQLGVFASRVQENLTGIRVVKAFAMEQEEIKKYELVNQDLKAKETRLSLLQAYMNPLLLLMNGFGTLCILLYGGYSYIHGNLTLGTILGFITYLGIMGWPISLLAFNTSQISQTNGAGKRVKEILDAPDQKSDDNGSRTDSFRGELTFNNVSFSYKESEPPVLDDLNFTINPGEKVALFGLTGAGKSTLISLIPRFYSPTQGKITIDGIPVEDWQLKALRAQIGIVLQETFLFSTTLAENISYGKPGASLDEIKEAAKNAMIHDFIETLPKGYQTKIGESGIGLSGGQRQRIAIARTLLQNPKLLILDDCTSSLDTITEHKIQMQLRELMKGRTTIIVAQRMAAYALVDRIIVLNKGKLQDFDSHYRLMERNSLYRTHYQSQMIDIPSEEV